MKKKYTSVIIYAGLILIPLLIYWQTTTFEFVWDDEGLHLTDNPNLGELSTANFLKIWKTPYKGLYIPVSYSVWMILKPIGQMFSSDPGISFNPFIYHLANLILHIINGILVFRLISYLVPDKWAVFGGTLLFLVHPVQVEAVAWVSELRGLLSTALGLSALHLYLIAGRKRSASTKAFLSLYIASCAIFSLAVLSKPSAVVFPLLAILLSIVILQQSLRPAIIRILPWFLIIIPIILVTKSVQTVDETVVLWVRPFIWMDAINFYLRKLIFPVFLAASYARTPQNIMDQWWLYLEWLIPLVIVYVIWRFRRDYPELVVSSLIFVIGFLPVSGLLSFTFQDWSTVADRFIYLSMLGVALGFAYGISRYRHFSFRVISGVLVVIWGVQTFAVQVPVWKNDYTLWNHCIRIMPNEEKAYLSKGEAFHRMTQYSLAIQDYNRALAINPHYAKAYNNRGTSLLLMKEYDRAMADLDQAIRINPQYSKAYYNKGIIFLENGKYDQAIENYTRAVEFNPQYTRAFYSRGVAFHEKGEYNQAINDYTSAIETNPRFEKAYNNRGVIFLLKKDYDRAIEDFTRALEINPLHAKVYKNRGDAFREINAYKMAIEDYTRAIAINPESIKAHFYRAVSYYYLKEYDKAWSDVSKIQQLRGEIDPDFLRTLKDISD